MSAHVSQGGVVNVSGSSGSATIYTSAPANGVFTIVVQHQGFATWIGWYDSTGNTLHGSDVLVGDSKSTKFGPMSTGDKLVAVAAEGDSTIYVGEIY